MALAAAEILERVSGGEIAVVRCVQRVGLWAGNVVGGRAGCSAAVLWLIFTAGVWCCSGCDSKVQGRRGGRPRGVPGRVSCLVVVFERSRGQVGRNCVEWDMRLVLVSSLGRFCTKNLFSELCFRKICPRRHGVGPSGVGGYMKERAAVGPHSQTAARFGPLSTSNGEGASA